MRYGWGNRQPPTVQCSRARNYLTMHPDMCTPSPARTRSMTRRLCMFNVVHSSDTLYMYSTCTVSVRAVLTIPHRPFMPICGEPATITAPISSSWHLVVVAGQVRAAIVRHRPRTAAPAHAKVSYSQSPILRIVLLHG